MGTFSVGGLATGLDTKTIISQLMQLEARPKVRMEWNRALWEARKSTWNDVNTRLNSLHGFANALMSPSTWSSAGGITSSDPTKLGAALAGPGAATATYAVDIASLAADEVWGASASLPAANGAVRQSGTWFDGAMSSASSGTLLTSLTDFDGLTLGLDPGSTITMNATAGGSPVTATYGVTATSTLDDLAAWAESNFPGAAFTVNGDGTITYQSATGGSNAITALTFTAVDSFGASLATFDATEGASSNPVSPATGGAAANDTLTITQGASSWNIAVNQGDDEAAIAAAINGTTGIGVTATIVGGRLQLASNVNGAAGSFTATSSGTLVADLGLAESTAGQDASFSVDGTSYTRSVNTGITDVLTDVSLNLLSTTASSVTLDVKGAAPAAAGDIKKKVVDFVNQYNSILDLIASKTGEQKVVNPKNLGDYLKGPLARDYSLSSIAFELRRWTTDVVGGLPSGARMLADIGITTGAVSASFNSDNVTGKLVIDEAKLEAAIAADPSKVRDIFSRIGGGTLADDGIARRTSRLVSMWRTGGTIDAALQGATSQIQRLQGSIDRFEDRLERKQAYYERMFSSLETNIGRMQSQGSWLSGQLAGLQ